MWSQVIFYKNFKIYSFNCQPVFVFWKCNWFIIICLLFCIHVRILIELTMLLGATCLNKVLIDLLIDSVRACSEPLEIDDLAEVHARSRLRLKSDDSWPRGICGGGCFPSWETDIHYCLLTASYKLMFFILYTSVKLLDSITSVKVTACFFFLLHCLDSKPLSWLVFPKLFDTDQLIAKWIM